MRKLVGAVIVAVVLTGCAGPANAGPCKDFIRQADTSMGYALDLANSGDLTSAGAVMTDLVEVLAPFEEAATGEPQKAMSAYVVSVYLFNGGGDVNLKDRLGRVRDACTGDGVSL